MPIPSIPDTLALVATFAVEAKKLRAMADQIERTAHAMLADRLARAQHDLDETERFRDEACGEAWDVAQAVQAAENVVPMRVSRGAR